MSGSLVAVEEHWLLPELRAALAGDDSLEFNDTGDRPARLADLGAGRLAAMDEQGIDVSILSLVPPGTHPLPAAEAVRLSRLANDTAAEAVSRHPSRLRAMATLPMSAPQEAVAELERAAGLGLTGCMVYGRCGQRHLDDPVYDDLFAAAAESGQPVFLHPQLPPQDLRDAAYRGLGPEVDLALASFGWGWHVEAGTAALRLILRGTFDRHPELQLVLGHWGELLPFWLDRAQSLTHVAGLRRSVGECVRENLFLTASGMFNPALLRHALAVTTPDRLLFSTDYPFQHPGRHDIETFLSHLPAESHHAFTTTNAAHLYGIPT